MPSVAGRVDTVPRPSRRLTTALAAGALAVPLLLAGCSRDEAQVDTSNPTLAPGPGDGVVTDGSAPAGSTPAATSSGTGTGNGSGNAGRTSTSRSGSGSGSGATTSAPAGGTSTTTRSASGGTSTTKAGGGAIDSGNFPPGGLPTTTAGAGDGFLVGQVVDCGTTAGVCTPMSVPAVNALSGGASGSFAAAAPTDSAGNFHFALPPGDYVVVYYGGGGTCETRNGDDSPRTVHVSAGATANAGQVVCLPFSGRP